MTLNTFQQWQVDNGHHVTENIDGDEFHAPELCPLCVGEAARLFAASEAARYVDREESVRLLREADAIITAVATDDDHRADLNRQVIRLAETLTAVDA